MRVHVQTLLVCLLLALNPLTVLAAPTSSCHCFQDRLYEPTTPALADPYFLATTQNSLLSVVYRIPKRDIVKTKMGGADGDLLWVIYSISDHYDVNTEDVVILWERLHDWMLVLDDISRLNKSTVQAIPVPSLSLKTTSTFADAIVHHLLQSRFGVLPFSIDTLVAAGATRKELLLSVLLAGKLERSVLSIWISTNNAGSTWGSLLFEAQIDPKGIAAEWTSLIDSDKDVQNARH